MKAPTLYFNTSIIGGRFDDEWAEHTRVLFRLAERGIFRLVTSVVAVREPVNAPTEVREYFLSTFSDSAQILDRGS